MELTADQIDTIRQGFRIELLKQNEKELDRYVEFVSDPTNEDRYQIARIKDAEKTVAREARKNERIAAMAEVRQRNRLEIWPSGCPTCIAQPGESCISRNGLRYGGRHTARAKALGR